ncbi:MAG: hypothetical protein ACKVT0_04945, partial [Planctomycetaceae bacterium]
MGPSELLGVVAGFLEREQIPYFVTGSLATIAYGEPRFTIDIDMVVSLSAEKINLLCDTFQPPEFYISEDAVRRAIKSRRQFNIIHTTSGLKVDVMIPTDSEFNHLRFARAVQLSAGGDVCAWFASPEDVILKKLEYFREGGSEKHIRDILGVLRIKGSAIDREYISDWASKMN